MLDPARLVFIDETAVSTNMVRLRGRAPRGVRVIGAVPLGRWETITFVAALRHNKMVAPMVVEGAMTGEMFLAYVENCLVPTLRRNDIVMMDNCRVHLGPGIRRAIEKAGATLRYLPKYSPDLNPIDIDQAWRLSRHCCGGWGDRRGGSWRQSPPRHWRCAYRLEGRNCGLVGVDEFGAAGTDFDKAAA